MTLDDRRKRIIETALLHRTIPFFELNEVSNVKLDFIFFFNFCMCPLLP